MSERGKYKGLIHLAGLVVVVPWVVWNVAISDTVRFARDTRRIVGEIALLQGQRHDGGGEPIYTGTAGELQSGGLIPRIMTCDAGARCTVVKYTPYLTESRDGLAVHTAELVLGGGYADLVRLVERAEADPAANRLVSVVFRSVRQRQPRMPLLLEVTLVLQQITENR